jgi:hypothetical protein
MGFWQKRKILLIIHDRAFLPEQPPIRSMWKSMKSFGRNGSSTPVTRVGR